MTIATCKGNAFWQCRRPHRQPAGTVPSPVASSPRGRRGSSTALILPSRLARPRLRSVTGLALTTIFLAGCGTTINYNGTNQPLPYLFNNTTDSTNG